jgi:hypothetical protein
VIANATASGSNIYYSTNYGITWLLSPTNPTTWRVCAISQNGVYALATVGGGAVYSSKLTHIGVVTNGLVKVAVPDNINAPPSRVLNFVNSSGYGIYTNSSSIASRGNTLDWYSYDFNSATITTRPVLTMRPEGNVGIGTATPGQTLDVNGITRSAGVINTSPAHYIGYTTSNPTIFQSNGTNNTSGTIYSGVYNYVAFPTNLQTPAGFITPVGGKYTVAFSGIYSITFTTGTGASNNSQLETFIAKNQYNNSTDLNQPGTGTLTSSYHPASTSQWSFSWTGYLSTSDFFTVGFFTSATAGTLSVRSTLSVALVQRTA